MPTKADTRRVERRYLAAKRKYDQALRIFAGTEISIGHTFPEFKPTKDSVEFTTYFFYRGKKWRFDYEINLLEKLPRVSHIRELLWETLKEARESPLASGAPPCGSPAHQGVSWMVQRGNVPGSHSLGS